MDIAEFDLVKMVDGAFDTVKNSAADKGLEVRLKKLNF